MLLVILRFKAIEMVLVQHFLELEQRGGLMAADVSQVIGALAPYGHAGYFVIFVYGDLVVVGVGVAFYPESGGTQYRIGLYELYPAGGKNTLPPTDHLIGAVIINVF
jgi:hypothetical protein